MFLNLAPDIYIFRLSKKNINQKASVQYHGTLSRWNVRIRNLYHFNKDENSTYLSVHK